MIFFSFCTLTQCTNSVNEVELCVCLYTLNIFSLQAMGRLRIVLTSGEMPAVMAVWLACLRETAFLQYAQYGFISVLCSPRENSKKLCSPVKGVIRARVLVSESGLRRRSPLSGGVSTLPRLCADDFIPQYYNNHLLYASLCLYVVAAP